MESFEQKLQRVLAEEVALAPYDPAWPEMFLREKAHLLACLPAGIVGRIEHIGSTAVPGLAAKPIVDVMVEVRDLDVVRAEVAPLLESQGYDYFWRPTAGDDTPPFYAWFIKRDRTTGARTHHVHMVEPHFASHWDRVLFRDYLVEHPEAAKDYEALKCRLAGAFAHDRVAYTRGKTDFIEGITARARLLYAAARLSTLEQVWKAAATRRDLEGMLSIYAEDARELLPGMPALVGRAAIRNLYRDRIDAFPRFHHEYDADDLTVSGDLAVVRGCYRFTPDAAHPDGAETGTFVGVWRFREGDWRLQVIVSNAGGPPA